MTHTKVNDFQGSMQRVSATNWAKIHNLVFGDILQELTTQTHKHTDRQKKPST